MPTYIKSASHETIYSIAAKASKEPVLFTFAARMYSASSTFYEK